MICIIRRVILKVVIDSNDNVVSEGIDCTRFIKNSKYCGTSGNVQKNFGNSDFENDNFGNFNFENHNFRLLSL